MNYKNSSRTSVSLKSQGLYRKFRAINRNKSSFPKATERFEEKERGRSLCSNDYLNLSQHPQVTQTSVEVINQLEQALGYRNISRHLYHVDLENLLAELHRRISTSISIRLYS